MVTVGGESSPVIPLESGSAQRVASGGSGLGPRTVVAKPLPPRQQMSPALTNLVPAHQTPSPLQGVYNHKYMHTYMPGKYVTTFAKIGSYFPQFSI